MKSPASVDTFDMSFSSKSITLPFDIYNSNKQKAHHRNLSNIVYSTTQFPDVVKNVVPFFPIFITNLCAADIDVKLLPYLSERNSGVLGQAYNPNNVLFLEIPILYEPGKALNIFYPTFKGSTFRTLTFFCESLFSNREKS